MKKTMRGLVWALFGYYLMLLLWIILFKMSFAPAGLDRLRAVNWIPFAESAYPDSRINLTEIFSNILIFVPFGLYLSMLKGEWPLLKKLAPIFAASLALEILQYALALGVSDVTDLLGNTLGGAIGLLLYGIVLRLNKSPGKTNRLLAILALAGSVCATGLLLVLLLGN